MNKIIYLGIPGSYSYIATQKYFGNDHMSGIQSIKKIFTDLVNRKADYGVVPLENSTTGSILETYDQLIKNDLSIYGEINLKIHHNLLGLNNNIKLEDIKKCYSHPQAISQCEGFFESNRQIKPVFTTDTATGALLVSKNMNIYETAISSREAGKIYGLKLLKRNVEDNKNNVTRFAVISRQKNNNGNKVSIAFSVRHIPGSLFKALRSYANLGLNLTKIESRPLFGKTWEYIFFVDFGIDNNLSNFHKMIKEMKEVTEFIIVLGIYEKGSTYET